MLEKGKLSWEVVSVGSFLGLLNPAALGLLVLLGPLPGPALLRPGSSDQEGCLPLPSPPSQPQRNTPPSPFPISPLLDFPHLSSPSSPPHPSSSFSALLTPLHPSTPCPYSIQTSALNLPHRPSHLPNRFASSFAHSYLSSLHLYGAVDHPVQDFKLRVQLDAGQAFPLPLGREAWGEEEKGVRGSRWPPEGGGWGLPARGSFPLQALAKG